MTNNNNNADSNQTNKISKIIDDVLKSCKPSNHELEILSNIDRNIKKEIREKFSSLIVDVITGGSFAKGTNLKFDTDIDVFILIDPNIEEKKFEKLALDIGFTALKDHNPRTRYAEHPYVEGFVKIDEKIRSNQFVRINLVPCYNVQKGKWKSSADRSQFHVKYMKRMLNENQKDEVRLLKIFLKTIEVYGAEISTSGFSGYVSEVLILKFGDFKSVINYMANITKPNTIISINSSDNNHEQLLKFDSPVIILDPIDNNRNLGAAISSNSLAKFIQNARSFLKRPSISYFDVSINQYKNSFMNDRYEEHIKNLSDNIIFIKFKYEYNSPDIIWGQLKKTAKAITRYLTEKDFEIIRHSIYSNDNDMAIIAILVKYSELPKFYYKIGPSIFMKDESEKFIDTNINKSISMWMDDLKIACVSERDESNIIKIIDTMLKKKY